MNYDEKIKNLKIFFVNSYSFVPLKVENRL